MRDYAFDAQGFWKVNVDDQGRLVGVPQLISDAEWGKAVASMIDGYTRGSNRIAEPSGSERHVTNKRVTDEEFYNYVIARVAHQVERRHLSVADEDTLLHRLYGDNPNIVRLVRSRDPVLAQRIWGSKRVQRYSQNDAPPTEPAPSPADVVQNAEPTQGLGPVIAAPPLGSRPTEPISRPHDDGTPATATSPIADPKTGGDPVILFSGQLFLQVTDLEVAGRGLSFDLTRTYLHQTVYRGPLGFCWDHTYNLWLREEQEIGADGTLVNAVYRSTGQVREDRYVQVLEGGLGLLPELGEVQDAVFEAPAGFFERLVKTGGQYVLEGLDAVRIYYSQDLQAERIVDRNGNEIRLRYDSDRRLDKVTDPVGKEFIFEHDELNLLRRVRDIRGKREVRYHYGDNGDLVGVDLCPDDLTPCETDYTYLGPDVPYDLQHNMTSVINSLGQTTLETAYGADPDSWTFNRVVWQRSASGEFDYDYGPVIDASDALVDPGVDPENFPQNWAVVLDQRRHAVEHWFNRQGHVVLRRELGTSGDLLAHFRYNADGLLVEEVHPGSDAVEYRYWRETYAELHGGDASGATPEERQTFGLMLRRVERPREGLGESRRLVNDFRYDLEGRLTAQRGPYYATPTLVPLAGQVVSEVTYAYDVRGNMTEIQYPPVESGFGLAEAVPPQRFIYDELGRLTDVTVGPVRTHYDYFTDSMRSGFVERTVQDADGVALSTTYDVDDLGRLLQLVSPYGAVDEQEWNGFDLVVKSRRIDPGRILTESTFQYNAGRRLIHSHSQVRDETDALHPDGPLVSAYRYDQYGRLIEYAEGNSAISRLRVVKMVLGPDGRIERTIDPRGTKTRFVRNAHGRVTRLVRAAETALESTRRFTYNIAGEMTHYTDALGHMCTFDRDAFGRVYRVLDADGNEILMERDAAGRITRQQIQGPHPETGAIVRWSEVSSEHDTFGRTIRATRHLFNPGDPGPERMLLTRYRFHQLGPLAEERDPTGASANAQYDGLARMVRLVDPAGTVTEWDYDDSARTVTTTTSHKGEDTDGNPVTQVTRSSVRFDSRGREIERIDSGGNVVRLIRNSLGLVGERIDPAGETTFLKYDLFARLVKVSGKIDGRTPTSQISYDANGNRTRLLDSAGNVINWQFDPLDRPTRVQRATTFATMVYDAEDRCVKTIDEDGVTIRRIFSPNGNMIRIESDVAYAVPPPSDPTYLPALLGPMSFVFTPTGLPARATNGVADISLRYDSLDRLVTETIDGESLSMAYDDAGHRTRLVYPSGREVEYSYGTGGYLEAITHLRDGVSYPGAPGLPTPRLLLSITRIGDQVSGRLLQQCSVKYSFDALRRVVGATWDMTSGAVALEERRLRDARGSILFEQSDSWSRMIEVDALGRQVGVIEKTGMLPVTVTGLDPPTDSIGLPAPSQTSVLARIPPSPADPDSTNRYVLDDTGNRITTTEVVTPSSTVQTTNYIRGPFHTYQRVGGEEINYDRSGNTIAIGNTRFRYDVLHRLVEIIGAGGTTKITRDALGRPRHIEKAGSKTILTWVGHELLAWREGLKVRQIVPTGESFCHLAMDGDEYVPLTDAAGSVLGWIDRAANRISTARYDPFGQVRSRTGFWPAPFGFHGYWEADEGIYLLLARAYHPRLGRFLQRDPMGYVDGVNLYQFAGNLPSTFTDRLGHTSTEIDWGTVGWEAAKSAVIGIGVAAGVAGIAAFAGIPLLLVGGAMLVSGGVMAYGQREEAAIRAGKGNASGEIALAALEDMTMVSGIHEAFTGRDILTDRALSGQEKSEHLGGSIGGLAAMAMAGGIGKGKGGFPKGLNPEQLEALRIQMTNQRFAGSLPIEQAEAMNLKLVRRGGPGERGIGLMELDTSGLDSEGVARMVESFRGADFEAGGTGGLTMNPHADGLGPWAKSARSLARTSLDLRKGEAAGHLLDTIGGGDPFGPIMGQPSGSNSSIGAQWNTRYRPGFTFEGFTLVERGTGKVLYPSMAHEVDPGKFIHIKP